MIAGEFTESAGIAAAEQLLARPTVPTAVFAANDLIAAGVLHGLECGGMRVPDDVSLGGFDNTLYAGMGRISLTTIDQPRVEMGRLAIETLVDRLTGTRTGDVTRILQPELVRRSSTGPPPTRRR